MQTAVFFAERMALELKILKQIIFGQVEVDANDTPIFLASANLLDQVKGEMGRWRGMGRTTMGWVFFPSFQK